METASSTVSTSSDLGQAVGGLIDAVGGGNAVTIAIAALAVLALLLNYPPVRDALRGFRDWLRPLILAVVAAAETFLVALHGGAGAFEAVVATLTASVVVGYAQRFFQQATDGNNEFEK